MERQIHGIEYQNSVIERLGVVSTDYTNKWDSYYSIGGNLYPLSIKCVRNGSGIDMGDFKRQTMIDEDFLLCIGFWSVEKSNIIDEKLILIKNSNWRKYFGDLSIIDDMLNEMKEISNNKEDDYKWKQFMTKWKKSYGNAVIKLRFKRDHKNQKRIQCGITKNNFLSIIKENINLN